MYTSITNCICIDYELGVCYYCYMELYSEIKHKNIDYTLLKKQLFVNKLVAIFFYLIISVLFIVSHFQPEPYSPFAGYFNFFHSPEVFSSVELELELPERQKVVSYDAKNDVFIICTNLFEANTDYLEDFYSPEELASGEIYLYGFASHNEVLVTPAYIGILAISGDYAIVVRQYIPNKASSFDDIQMRIGLVKFRGENAGDRTNFDAEYASMADDILLESQMQFVNDRYIAVRNNINDIDLAKNIVTFYDFKSYHRLLEVFKVRAELGYTFLLAEDNLVAMTNNKAEFYRINQVDEEGYLVLNDYYIPFFEDKGNELIDSMTTMVSYLGNDWFLRQGYIQMKKDEIALEDLAFIEGRVILIDAIDDFTGQRDEYYLLMRSDRYNSGSGVNLKDSRLIPDMVANKYNADSTRDISDYINNTMEESIVENKYAYYPPSMPVGALPKDGMSIVYYYWFPYDNRPEVYEISFCMMDTHGNIYHPKENIYMPLLFIDGRAFQIGDPDYEVPRGDVALIDRHNREEVFKNASDDYAYVSVGYSNNILIVGQYAKREGVEELFYGAFNESGRQITHFKYIELSLFYGDYAIGMNKVGDDYRYYRIDKNGKEEAILTDVLATKNGVYITTDGTMVGLKSYDGKVLLDNEFESIDVLDTFLIDGKFQKSVVLAHKNNRTYIYTLK